MMRAHSCLGLWLAASALAAAQQQPVIAKAVHAGAVQCSENALSARSEVVKSSQGYRAFVEVKGRLHRQGKTISGCQVQKILHVAGIGRASQAWVVEEMNYSTEDAEFSAEEDFEIIGWSADGERLLAATVEAQGDYDVTTPLVWSAVSHAFVRLPLERSFVRLLPENCSVGHYPVGFLADGRVLLDVVPFDSDDLARGERPCAEKGTWALDVRTHQLAKLASDMESEHFGELLEDASTTAKEQNGSRSK